MRVNLSKIRLFCFPAGGAGASMYRTWSTLLGENIQIVPVQFPGREDRHADALRFSVASLVEYVRQTFVTGEDLFAFFGHSLGALVSFEVARDLRRRGLRIPTALFVSGYPAPHLPRNRPKISHLEKEEFLSTLIEHFDVTAEIIQDRALLDYIYPVLHADIAAVEGYTYFVEPPLDSRIVALGGTDDREALKPELLEWRRETRQSFVLHLLPGGHFYLMSEKEKLAQIVRQELGRV